MHRTAPVDPTFDSCQLPIGHLCTQAGQRSHGRPSLLRAPLLADPSTQLTTSRLAHVVGLRFPATKYTHVMFLLYTPSRIINSHH